MNKSTLLLKKAYYALNTRDIDKALSTMHADITWPIGTEGGYIQGHSQVSSYWKKQWELIDPDAEPLEITASDGNHLVVQARQIIRDRHQNLISDEIVCHKYLIEDGLIRNMEVLKQN